MPWFLVLVVCVASVALVRPFSARSGRAAIRGLGIAMGLEFPLDDQGQLTLDRHSEVVILEMLTRLRRSSACFVALVGLTYLALINGPPLSSSPTFSVSLAVVVCLAVIGPYCLVRPLLAPLSGGSSSSARRVDLRDYVSPTRRAFFWVGCAGVLAIPVACGVMAQSGTFDGSRLYWAGLLGLPLTCAAVLIDVESRMSDLRDQPAHVWTSYLGDAFRTRALRRVWTFGTAGAAIAWSMVSEVLVGVALEPAHRLHWVLAASSDARALALLLGLGSFYFWFMPTRRFRRRLWAGLKPRDNIKWDPSEVPSTV